jgi:hypothetical protein
MVLEISSFRKIEERALVQTGFSCAPEGARTSWVAAQMDFNPEWVCDGVPWSGWMQPFRVKETLI